MSMHKPTDQGETVQLTEETPHARLENARQELHELCQPVTAMLCLLELAKMQGDEEHMREGIDHALRECVRLVSSVERMRYALGEVDKGGAA
jgi:hypothetical protein